MIRVKNWSKYQSYKDRRPPWIRFHRSILDDFQFQSMTADSRALLPMLWLLACEDKDPTSGLIQHDIKVIAFRLRISEEIIDRCLDELQNSEFIERVGEGNKFELSDNDTGTIYFMLDESANEIKIGFTDRDIVIRKQEIERKTGRSLKLVHTENGRYREEKVLHEKFSRYATENNEWFQYVKELKSYVTLPLRRRNSGVTPETETETETETEESRSTAPSRFDDFWVQYPKKKDKKKTKELWKRRKLDNMADRIIADLINRKANDRQWIDGFIPNPTTYLNGERWEDEIETSRAGKQQFDMGGFLNDKFTEATNGEEMGGSPVRQIESDIS